MLTSRPSSFSAADIDSGDTPRVFANRKQVDTRFSVLGFTVDSGGMPYYEVLLATDRTLFDPANASRRNASNFYASREHSGLIQAESRDSIYVLPTAVLRELAKAPEIYYTVVAYRTPDAAGPVMAHSHSLLAAGGPSVSVAPGLHRAMSMEVLSAPLEKLCRIRHDGNGHNGRHAPAEASALAEIDAAADRAEGEDGYGMEPPTAMEAGYGDGYDDEYGAGMSDDDYDDGYGAPAATSHAAENSGDDEGESYGATQSTPSMLEDEDYDDDDKPAPAAKASAADEYDDGMGALELDSSGYDGASAYRTESLESDAPEYESLDAPPPPIVVPPVTAPAARRALDVPAKIALIQRIAPFESGKDGYAAINPDGEFEGRFPGHPAQGKYHIGLSYGIVQFTQDSGSLGRLLGMMRDRNAPKFREVFGPDSDKLVAVTNAEGPPSSQSPGGRSARVQPVAGADLWRAPWVARFREAARPDLFGTGSRQIFNGAQNELASILYLDPMLRFARWLGLDTDRALAILLDRSIQMGETGARQWIIEAAGPVKTPAYLQQAFAALNTELGAFQASTPGLKERGVFGPDTHAALTAALRASGRSPFPIPARNQMLDAIQLRADSTPWARRTAELRAATDFTDVEFAV